MSVLLALLALATPSTSLGTGQDKIDLKPILEREIIGKQTSLEEVREFIDPRIPSMPVVQSAAEWQRIADQLRRDMLDKVVYRGEAKKWRELPTRVEWAGEITGLPGYRIRKLRYEVVPGLWAPALFYVPDKLSGKVPVHLAVNGHDGKGKAAEYKQLRCINLAKRGIISLNLEWVGMGQLRGAGYGHYLMNQLDLCGTSGLSVFYSSLKRGLDVLLSHENADPARVAVSGLSGGSWQTIYISALDTRVTLTNPVAGYSSFKTRNRHTKDLGDSEQTPIDMATVADYAHFTAMMAPRATLLTFNSKDNCCFESNYALQPLMDAAQPVFRLHGRETHLRSHVNHVPGDHNFGQDNREALYRMIGDHFYPDDPGYDPREIPSQPEVKAQPELDVELPAGNASFSSLARDLMKDLPRNPNAAPSRARLRELLRTKDFKVVAGTIAKEERTGHKVAWWKLMMGSSFTVPAVEIAPAKPETTVLLFSETGRRSMAADVDRLLAAGHRVIVIDPFTYGESKIATHDFLYAMLVAATGERPLGILAAQIGAGARWAQAEFKGPVKIAAVGPRAGLVALCAAALEEKAIGSVELSKPMASLKEIIEKGMGVNQAPELFCFGLLEEFDLKQIAALVAPRPVETR